MFSFIITPDFWSCNHVFITSFQREQLASWSRLWKERKEPHHPLKKNWKEIRYDHKIRIKIFWFPISAHPRLHPRVNVIFVS
jgi:hypothetical protein